MTERRKAVAGEWVRWGVLLIIGLAGWIFAFGRAEGSRQDLQGLPPRVSALERKVDVVESQRAEDRAMLQEMRNDIKTLIRERRR
jgi:chaperonin cofactor prefoldin